MENLNLESKAWGKLSNGGNMDCESNSEPGDGKYRLEIRVDDLPKTPAVLAGMTFAAKIGHAKRWEAKIWKMVFRNPPQFPLQRAKVRLIRHSSGKLDHMAMIESFRVVIDALKSCKVLASTFESTSGEPEYLHERAGQRVGFIRIEIEEL